jgi:signal transduction histidine kinase
MATRREHRAVDERSSSNGPKVGVRLDPFHERLTDLERRSLLAEQVRQQAHSLRTPLSVIDLVTETMQLQAGDDTNRADRLARIRGASGSLATELSDAVKATRFGDGPREWIDPVQLAADVVVTFGGELQPDEASVRATGKPTLVEPDSLQAALVHALRLVGVGTDCNGICAQRPLLRTECDTDALILVIEAAGDAPPDTPRERADLQLMELAAQRIANDHGGSLRLSPTSATFRLPLSDRRT